ncbi:MAG: family 20 glycosylhydrolase [Bacteroidales bacterium]|nr:family 20 glycosylhydrolase [Bacteroidales bacterium]
MKKSLLLFITLLAVCSTSVLRADDFAVRALHIDLRTQVITPAGLQRTADKAAAAGLNTIIMEWEANFPFQDNATLCGRNAYTQQEVKDFIAYCGQKGLEVIPLQNCFGHAEYILRHERYAPLREDSQDFSQVCPSKIDACTKVFESIFAEIAAMHPSKYIHIGADETRLLGHCRTCAAKDKSDLFVDYVNAMCRIVKRLGKTPIIWADMLLKHPAAADRLPKDLIILDWNYGWETNRFGDIDGLLAKGFEMWGACALRSHPDDVMTTCWDKHLGNLQDYVAFCREKGFTGIVETCWSTSGTYGYLKGNMETFDIQPIREVYPLNGFDMLIAAFGHAVQAPQRIDTHAFVRDYCQKEFGIDSEEAQTLDDYFFTPQKALSVMSHKAADFEAELNVVEGLRQRMAAISPKHGTAQWNHLALMLDIRANFLAYKMVECEFESPTYHAAQAPLLAARLRPLMQTAESLRARYIQQNAFYLKRPEMPLGEWSYVQKLKNLYDCVN